MLDACGRTIDYVRISITDRCNLRCIYCMPQEGVTCLGHGDILTFEEIERVVRALQHLGVRYVRVTGGEPMARLGCLDLVDRIHHIPGIEEIAMTTNGILLDGQVSRAKQAGLNALNISLDTLDPDAYRRMTRGGRAGQGASGDKRCPGSGAAGEDQCRSCPGVERSRADGAGGHGQGPEHLRALYRADARGLRRGAVTHSLRRAGDANGRGLWSPLQG